MIGIDAIHRAQARIEGWIRPTPLVLSPSLSKADGAPVYLKLEHHQITGSFKLRGATNAVLALPAAQRQRGVVGVSTGNHGRGLAHAAQQAGVRCIICMSSLVPKNKVEGLGFGRPRRDPRQQGGAGRPGRHHCQRAEHRHEPASPADFRRTRTF